MKVERSRTGGGQAGPREKIPRREGKTDTAELSKESGRKGCKKLSRNTVTENRWKKCEREKARKKKPSRRVKLPPWKKEKKK